MDAAPTPLDSRSTRPARRESTHRPARQHRGAGGGRDGDRLRSRWVPWLSVRWPWARLAIGRLAIGRARIRRLEIDDLVIRKLRLPSDRDPAA